MSSRTRVPAGILLLLLSWAGCTSSGAGAATGITIRIQQLPDAGIVVEDRGALSIAYEMTIRNERQEAIRLRNVEMRAVDGPYTLRRTPVPLDQTIEAGGEAVVTFTMWGYRRERRSASDKTVWVSGAAFFDTATGSLRKEFTDSFREP